MENSDIESLSLAREVLADMIRYGVISATPQEYGYYVPDTVISKIMGHTTDFELNGQDRY